MAASVQRLKCGFKQQGDSPSFHGPDLAASRFDELLKSNNPPLQAEHAHLENVIGEGHVFLSGLKERITRTRAVLQELLDEEKRVERLVESCKKIIRPIRSVPEDIIREIFLTCLDTDEREIKDSLDGKSPPLVVSKVCRNWRSVAVSTSQLWSFLSLHFDQYRDAKACLYLLQIYLLRSGTQDIVLSLHSTETLSNNHVIPVLLSSAPRWVDIRIFIPFLSLRDFSAVRGTLYRLNRLHVKFTDDPRTSPGPQVKPNFDAFEYAPLLRSFSHESVCNAVHQISIPWSRIVEYTGMDWISSYIEMFKLTPDLESASLYCEDDSLLDRPLPPPFCHHALRRLHVHEEEQPVDADVQSEGGIVLLLSHIECPALESLSMVYNHPQIRIPSSYCAGNLRTLSIDAPYAIPAEAQSDLIGLLKTIPSLTHLSMSMSMSPEEGVILLGLNINIFPDVVPGLKSLTCRILSERPDLSSVFVDFVESRRTRLETLRLSVLVDRWTELCEGNFVIYGME
ncbi:hypothetical protein IW262DRAFT_1335795 [Armillaria fumosa]|nr:hypothetical protein IW262DRAFT_1335795 [Armillaria fumosa]